MILSGNKLYGSLTLYADIFMPIMVVNYVAKHRVALLAAFIWDIIVTENPVQNVNN